MAHKRPFRFGVAPFGTESRKDWVEQARKIEDLGYSTMLMPDHFGEKRALQGATRYEDTLRELREKYEEEVQRAEKKFLKDNEIFDRQRSEALKRTIKQVKAD